IKSEIDFMSFHLEKQLSQSGFMFMENKQDVFQGKQKIYNILAYSFDKDKLQRGWERFKKRKDVTLVTSSPFNLELGHPDASKGNAVRYLAKVLNKTLSVSMAVGDSGNDTSMFAAVSDSYAMANADDEVKSKAKYVTGTNDEDGVAQAIYDFLNRTKIQYGYRT
ncbi:MAG TPA: HAD hydrolase family protein, partial [Bacillota bacterium]|nr:HAD hydrolase family protein [Bacillota bacterium]